MVATLGRLQQQRGAPTYLFCDNGGEFSGRILDLTRAYHHRVRIDFSQSGQSQQITPMWNRSMRFDCAMNASTRTGSNPLTKQNSKSKLGGGITMRAGLTWLLENGRPKNMPHKCGKGPITKTKPSKKSLCRWTQKPKHTSNDPLDSQSTWINLPGRSLACAARPVLR